MRALIAVAVLGTSASADPVIEGRAGPPAIWDVVPGRLTEREFLDQQASFASSPDAVAVHELPAAQPDAWYGELRVRDKIVGWTVQGSASHGYFLTVDANANGDLTDDAALRFMPIADGLAVFTASVQMRIINGDLHSYVTRRGTLVVDGARVPFELVGIGHDYSLLTIDGNNAATMSRVRVGGHDYEVTIQPNGDAIQLHRGAVDHPVVGFGDLAPDIDATLADGSHFSLREHRGEIVVLDFWMRDCAPSERDRSGVEELAREVTVLSIGHDAREDQQTREWPHAVEGRSVLDDSDDGIHAFHWDSGPVHEVYDSVYSPDFFVIDADGRVTCAHCSLDEVKRVVHPDNR